MHKLWVTIALLQLVNRTPFLIQVFVAGLLFEFLICYHATCSLWWSDRIQRVIAVFLYLWRLCYVWVCGQFWKMFNEILRRRYIILCLGDIFCKCVRFICFLIFVRFSISVFNFCLDDLSLTEGWILKYPSIGVWRSVCVLSHNNVSFINWMALVFVT